MNSGFRYALALLFLIAAGVSASAKTVYVDLLDRDTRPSDGTYDRPYKSWRVALQHVTSGDTIYVNVRNQYNGGSTCPYPSCDVSLDLATPNRY